MLRVDDIERLSAWRAGELPEVEAAQVEAAVASDPELARALRRLERLDALSAEVANAPAPAAPAAEAAVRRAVEAARRPPAPRPPAPRPASFGWRGPALAAAALAAVVVGAALLRPPPPVAPQVEAASGSLATAPEVVAAQAGRAVLFEGAQVERAGDALVVRAGTALVEGRKLSVRCDGAELGVDGRALVSLEPARAVLHVTGAAEPNPYGDDMQRLKTEWLARPPSTAGMAVLLAVLSGSARAGDAAPLPPGGVWLAQARATASAPPSPAPAVAPVAASDRERQRPPRKVMLAEGMIPFPALRQSLLQVGPALARCFEAGRAQAPKLEGDLTLLVTVVQKGVGGRVEDVQVEGYTLHHPFVTSCVAQAVMALDFPAPTTPKAKLLIPLDFKARGEAGSEGVQVLVPSIDGEPATMHMPDRTARLEVRTPRAASFGPENAPVTMVALFDFECTFCVRAWATVQQLMPLYEGRVRFVFMQHPLPSHPGARKAAEAAVAAHQQGKFLDFGALLFAEQTMHDEAGLDGLARRAGLDLQRFRQSMADGSAAAAVEAHLAEAKRLGSRGTPAFFINGKEVVGARPLENFRQLLDAELEAARGGR